MKKTFLIIICTLIISGCKSGEIINISKDDLEKVVSNNNEIILYVGSESCPLCPSVSEDLDYISKNYGVNVHFLDITNYENNSVYMTELEKILEVEVIPPLIFSYENGEVENMIRGSHGRETLVKRFLEK